MFKKISLLLLYLGLVEPPFHLCTNIPCFNKTEEEELWNLRTHQEKSDSVNLGKICNTAYYMTNWQHQCLFNNPCLPHVTRVFF